MANKLITDFTPITTPANTRLMTLGDEITGQRFRINITQFFAIVDVPVVFTKVTAGSLVISSAATGLLGTFTRETSGNTTIQLRNSFDDLSLCKLDFGDSSSATAGSVQYDHSTDAMNFFTSAGQRLRLTNVGATFASLAGTGTRNVVVDANGLMSAP